MQSSGLNFRAFFPGQIGTGKQGELRWEQWEQWEQDSKSQGSPPISRLAGVPTCQLAKWEQWEHQECGP